MPRLAGCGASGPIVSTSWGALWPSRYRESSPSLSRAPLRVEPSPRGFPTRSGLIFWATTARAFFQESSTMNPNQPKLAPGEPKQALGDRKPAALETQLEAVNGWSAEYLEAQYALWLQNPNAVGEDWQRFFLGFDLGFRRSDESDGSAAPQGDGSAAPALAPKKAGGAIKASGASKRSSLPKLPPATPLFPGPAGGGYSMESRLDWGEEAESPVVKQAGVYSLARNYRRLGHFAAKLNPLGGNPKTHPQLELSCYGLSEADLDREFEANMEPPRRATLREIIASLKATYCGSLGIEFLHIQNASERRWIQKRLEPRHADPDYSSERHRSILKKLRLAEGFEKYLHAKFVGQKRFSLEGAESLIVALDALVQRAANAHNASDLILGMAHRGRLNVLANVMGKSYKLIFSEFEDNYLPESAQGDGDVKYHKGYSRDLRTEAGHVIHLTLAANPSHLEAIDPVVEGRARAKQALISRRGGALPAGAGSAENRVPMEWDGRRGAESLGCEPRFPTTDSRRKVLPVLVHGDAAFAGQGVVWETLNLSKLEGYTTGGTIHLIVNNQIGFTTSPKDARGTMYCTDAVKGVEAPIFHVNGDDPAAVSFAAELALDYRQEFGKDAVVDILCFRRWGHNESDEPAFTQPLMYEKIRRHPGAAKIYADKLAAEEHLTEDELAQIDREIQETLDSAREEAKDITGTQVIRLLDDQSLRGEWSGFKAGYRRESVETGVPRDNLQAMAERLAQTPANFHPHPKLKKLLERRMETVREGGPLDWANAEALAFASLLAEGTPIRLSGQDCRRGTFSQRHAVLIDSKTGDQYTPLDHIAEGQAVFEVYDSPLSEAGVLGFDYGISLADPHSLVMWEAQFGDFVNGAQVHIDQFLACAESKWRRLSGLVLLLPHGYEGQGPEHSSARLERFLQLCAENNMQVVYPTTPAQYFHLLRRQMMRSFRKPLVVMTPKSLLRHPKASSTTDELAQDRFREVLTDGAVEPGAVKRVVFCSGKVYYDLLERREEKKIGDVALIRVEQLYPLEGELLKAAVEPFANAREWVWTQEEPRNMGAWTFIAPRLRQIFGREFAFVGRGDAASPAVGSLSRHKSEQEQLVRQSLERKEVPEAAEILV
jgi:2-oxoglutarate dehydrogenase E1 component